MGTFFTEVHLASPALPARREMVKLLVDSGSLYTWVSAAVLRDLGIQPTERRRLLTIEGRTVDRGAAEIPITLEGRTLHTLCLFGEPGDLEVLGAYTLEGFGLAIDPVQRRLVPAILYGAGAPVACDEAGYGSRSATAI
ncbi:MAG: hypothetical protein HYR86_08490 [Candidatus Rokubacteria bacterium]|nr:hypothetical protein [Candidatus Rokubacteria bacterium]